jgi:hypothetical protein
MQLLVSEIAKKGSQEEALRYAYETLARKYRGSRIFTVLRLDRFLVTRVETLWKKSGFLHCNHMNYLLRTLLVRSRQFAPGDIEARWTRIWFFSPHQYLVIRLKNRETILVDLWGKVFGIPFGEYAHGFRSGSIIASESEHVMSQPLK